jgi:hypothetical protein
MPSQFKNANGQILYAHKDSRGIGGVIYKPYKPGTQAPSQSARQQNQRDAFSSNNQRSYKLVPTNQRDAWGRTIYQKQYIQPQVQSKTNRKAEDYPLPLVKQVGENNSSGKKLDVERKAPVPSAHDEQAGSSNDVKKPLPKALQKPLAKPSVAKSSLASGGGAPVFTNYMILGPNMKTSANIRTEKGAASFALENRSNKTITIQRKQNRYGDFEYRAAFMGEDPLRPGRQKMHTYDLGANYKYNNKYNHSTYKFKSDRFGEVKLESRDDRKYAYAGSRESVKDLQPRMDIHMNPGDQVSYLSPNGLGRSSTTVSVDGRKYEIANNRKSDYGYVIYRKQEDGSRKIFLKSDSPSAVEEEFKPDDYYSGFEVKDLGEIPKSKEEIQLEKDKLDDPFKDDISLKEALEKAELISPNLDAPELSDFKKAKNALRREIMFNFSLESSKQAEIDELLKTTNFSDDLSLEEKSNILSDISSKIKEIKTKPALESKRELPDEFKDLFEDIPRLEDVKNENSSKLPPNSEYKGSIVTEQVPGYNNLQGGFILPSPEMHEWLNKQPNLDSLDPFGEFQLVPRSKDPGLDQLFKDFDFDSLPKN